MKELMLKRGIWISAFICVLALLLGMPYGQIEPPLAAGSFLKFYRAALQSQIMVFFLPVAASLPAGAVFLQESKSGFLKLYCVRMNRMEYLKRKLFQVYVSGAFPFFLAGLLAFLICFLFFFALEIVGEIKGEEILEAFLLLMRICLIGGMLAELSGFFAAIFLNYYMAYGLPFVCFYFLVILKDRYLPDMYAMYPAEWILCEENWGESGNGIWLFLLAFTALALILHGFLLDLRLKEIV